jgi:hypothetical protein
VRRAQRRNAPRAPNGLLFIAGRVGGVASQASRYGVGLGSTMVAAIGSRRCPIRSHLPFRSQPLTRDDRGLSCSGSSKGTGRRPIRLRSRVRFATGTRAMQSRSEEGRFAWSPFVTTTPINRPRWSLKTCPSSTSEGSSHAPRDVLQRHAAFALVIGRAAWNPLRSFWFDPMQRWICRIR